MAQFVVTKLYKDDEEADTLPACKAVDHTCLRAMMLEIMPCRLNLDLPSQCLASKIVIHLLKGSMQQDAQAHSSGKSKIVLMCQMKRRVSSHATA